MNIPVWFKFRIGPFFPMLLMRHRENKPVEGRLHFTDQFDRVTMAAEFTQARITRIRVLPGPRGGTGSGDAEMEITAKDWKFHTKVSGSPGTEWKPATR